MRLSGGGRGSRLVRHRGLRPYPRLVPLLLSAVIVNVALMLGGVGLPLWGRLKSRWALVEFAGKGVPCQLLLSS